MNICSSADLFLFIEVSPSLSQAPTEEPTSELPSISNPVLDAPEFPEFENSEVKTAEGATIDIAALELEALDFVSTDLPAPVDFGITYFKSSQPDLSVCDPPEPTASCIMQDLNLGSQNIIPLDPASFPEPINPSEFPEASAPEQWSQSEEADIDPPSNSQAGETDLGGAECHSFPEDTELNSHTELNSSIQPHPR